MTRAAAIAAAAALLATASCGTFASRIGAHVPFESPFVGWYPGAAVGWDALGIVVGVSEVGWGAADEGARSFVLCLLSLPLDLVLDTALLPLDLVAGIAGWHKICP